MPSTASRLKSDLNSLTERLADLVRELPVEWLDTHGGGFTIIAPEYYWGEASAEQLKAQLAIKRDYEEWFEVFRSVFRTATDDLNQRIEAADQRIRKWIELSSNWSLRPNHVSNEKNLRDDAELFVKILEIVEVSGAVEIHFDSRHERNNWQA